MGDIRSRWQVARHGLTFPAVYSLVFLAKARSSARGVAGTVFAALSAFLSIEDIRDLPELNREMHVLGREEVGAMEELIPQFRD